MPESSCPESLEATFTIRARCFHRHIAAYTALLWWICAKARSATKQVQSTASMDGPGVGEPGRAASTAALPGRRASAEVPPPPPRPRPHNRLATRSRDRGEDGAVLPVGDWNRKLRETKIGLWSGHGQCGDS